MPTDAPVFRTYLKSLKKRTAKNHKVNRALPMTLEDMNARDSAKPKSELEWNGQQYLACSYDEDVMDGKNAKDHRHHPKVGRGLA
ncbi:hypothetical protein IAT38_006070 [Cryptococcus sp. DSM 104549]